MFQLVTSNMRIPSLPLLSRSILEANHEHTFDLWWSHFKILLKFCVLFIVAGEFLVQTRLFQSIIFPLSSNLHKHAAAMFSHRIKLKLPPATLMGLLIILALRHKFLLWYYFKCDICVMKKSPLCSDFLLLGCSLFREQTDNWVNVKGIEGSKLENSAHCRSIFVDGRGNLPRSRLPINREISYYVINGGSNIWTFPNMSFSVTIWIRYECQIFRFSLVLIHTSNLLWLTKFPRLFTETTLWCQRELFFFAGSLIGFWDFHHKERKIRTSAVFTFIFLLTL